MNTNRNSTDPMEINHDATVGAKSLSSMVGRYKVNLEEKTSRLPHPESGPNYSGYDGQSPVGLIGGQLAAFILPSSAVLFHLHFPFPFPFAIFHFP